MTARPFAKAAQVVTHALAIAAAAFVLLVTVAPGSASDNDVVLPAALTSVVAMKRQNFHFRRPVLSNALLAAYVERRKALTSFSGFDLNRGTTELTEAMLSNYIARRRNQALDAIESVDVTSQPALTPSVLASYAETSFMPTMKRVKLAEGEKLCLAQAIYHEARGESSDGQMAVANVIINRAMSKQYPSTICGVVFQNADRGIHKCQFTFACDGRSDAAKERGAWNRAVKLAEAAFREFQQGERPGVIPNSVLFYHTTAVSPKWAHTYRRVAAIGSHLFYATP